MSEEKKQPAAAAAKKREAPRKAPAKKSAAKKPAAKKTSNLPVAVKKKQMTGEEPLHVIYANAHEEYNQWAADELKKWHEQQRRKNG